MSIDRLSLPLHGQADNARKVRFDIEKVILQIPESQSPGRFCVIASLGCGSNIIGRQCIEH